MGRNKNPTNIINFHIFMTFLLCFEKGFVLSPWLAWSSFYRNARFEFTEIPLPLPSKCWEQWCVPPCPASYDSIIRTCTHYKLYMLSQLCRFLCLVIWWLNENHEQKFACLIMIKQISRYKHMLEREKDNKRMHDFANIHPLLLFR